MENTAKLLTIDDVAKRLNVPKSWLYSQTRQAGTPGSIPCYRLGKYLRFDLERVEGWLAGKVADRSGR
jgi:excisionase family DNA binding protein